MTRINAAEILSSVTLDVDDRPLALRLPVGSALFAVQGKVWLTQERQIEDIVLVPGQRFDIRSNALVLVSAIHGTASVHVAQPDDAATSSATDIHDFAREQARLLRRREVGRLADAASARLASWKALARGFLAMLPRAVSP
jgi:hypothetical protein